MPAKAVRDILPDMHYEAKWDGFRTIAFRDGEEVELGSRNKRPIARYFPLADACQIGAGRRVLDATAGDGNFAILAATRGADGTACDLSQRMVERGRARTAAEGLAIAWGEADVEGMPFPDSAFDIVASVFGAMFGPRPDSVVDELFRVAAPGGLVAMANHGPGGFLAAFAELMSRYSRPAPVELPSAFAWSDPDEVRRRMDGHAEWLDLRPGTVTFHFDSPAEALEFWSGRIHR